ncbi:MAG: HPF/RaiA family ribosome-associated protein [Bacteriovoracia bacterium]
MSDRINCEHFSLTPSIREHVSKHIEDIKAVLPAHAEVVSFLCESNPRVFSVLFRAHVWGKDIVVKSTGDDLYAEITRAKRIFVQRAHELKEQRKRHRESRLASGLRPRA